MARVLKREAAKRDLIAQWVWYAENADTEVADRFLNAAEDTLSLLSTQPQIGTQFFVRKAELQGMRKFPVSAGFEKILLFYFPLKDALILFVWSMPAAKLIAFLLKGSSVEPDSLLNRSKPSR